jgi:SAM-dependent methyltransferase
MPVFADYARYYNLLYRDKDYGGETAFVLDMMRQQGCVPRTLLDLGCGTARHAIEMTRRGVQVTGVDISETMLAMGQESVRSLDPADFPVLLPELYQADARSVRLNKTFDAVVSLFHVMSYQNTEEDALAVMETARNHLNPGGLLLFDFWHGPGVQRDLPERRERVLENEETHIHRLALPEHRSNDHLVIVNYFVTLSKPDGSSSCLRESHSMRYWFLPELRLLANEAGFAVVQEGGWMSASLPGFLDWNAWSLCRRKG